MIIRFFFTFAIISVKMTEPAAEESRFRRFAIIPLKFIKLKGMIKFRVFVYFLGVKIKYRNSGKN